MVFVGEIPMVYRWYKWYIYSSWDYQPTYNLGGTTFAAKRESILKWSTVDAGTYLPFICFAIHKFKRPCSIPSSELTLNPWKVAMFNTRWCPHSYKLVSNPTPINPSYWTYLHQLSDSELGHHLVGKTSRITRGDQHGNPTWQSMRFFQRTKAPIDRGSSSHVWWHGRVPRGFDTLRGCQTEIWEDHLPTRPENRKTLRRMPCLNISYTQTKTKNAFEWGNWWLSLGFRVCLGFVPKVFNFFVM